MMPSFSYFVKFLRHLRFVGSPRRFLRVFRGYFATLVLRQDRLRSIELAVTYACQASCHKCYSANLPQPKSRFLSVERIKNIVEQAMELGLIHINLTGGEPTLRKDLPEIIKACHPEQITVSIVTNAIKISYEELKALKEAGLNTIQISIDSALPKEHDRLRGVPGCFHQALRVAKWARELKLNLVFSSVMSTENSREDLTEMYKLLDLAQKEGAFLLINDSAAVGGWEGQRDKMTSSATRNKNVFELLKHPSSRHHSMYNFRGKFGCPAGVEKLYVNAYGKVTPCNFIHDEYGDLATVPLKEMWNKMRKHEVYSQKMKDCVRFALGRNANI